MKLVYQKAFLLLAFLGRPFGGLRPHRFMHWIAHKGFSHDDVVTGPTHKVRASWGGVLNLHPFYHLDREVMIAGCYDRPLHLFLQGYVKPGMVILDVGANIGEIAMHMARLAGPTGRVYAFEPAPAVLARLRENVAMNGLEDRIQIIDSALSNESGLSPFGFAETSAENQGMGSLVNRENLVVTRQLLARTTTLDEFVAATGIKNIDLIKVDIQGGEIGFIEGGAQTLRKIGPDLVIEVSASDLTILGKTPADLLLVLEELGYRIHTFGKAGLSGAMVTSATIDSIPMSLNVFCTTKASA